MQPLKLLDKLRIEPELHLMNQIIRQVLEHLLDHAGEKRFPQGFVGWVLAVGHELVDALVKFEIDHLEDPAYDDRTAIVEDDCLLAFEAEWGVLKVGLIFGVG